MVAKRWWWNSLVPSLWKCCLIPDLNLLDYQLCPADIDAALWKVEAIAFGSSAIFKSPGLFAVEMFLDKNDEVLVNETV